MDLLIAIGPHNGWKTSYIISHVKGLRQAQFSSNNTDRQNLYGLQFQGSIHKSKLCALQINLSLARKENIPANKKENMNHSART